MVRAALAFLLISAPSPAGAPTEATIAVRGKTLTLHLYGSKDGTPAVVTSGDGGWVHLGPAVAEFLASQGYFAVGVDAKAYLSTFTSGKKTLAPQDVPGDFRVFVDYARRGRDLKVPLVGVSEGAGLSVLAASDPPLQASLLGVLGLGLPDVNELGWRWRDDLIYVTKKTPNEPTFKASDYVGQLGSLPLAAIHSSHDEYVSLDEVKRVVEPLTPKRRLWLVEATDHRFSDNTAEMRKRLLEALEWFKTAGSSRAPE